MNDIWSVKYAVEKLSSSAHLILWDQENDQYFKIAGMSYGPDISISLVPISKEEAYEGK
jgi:hypothetical protein